MRKLKVFLIVVMNFISHVMNIGLGRSRILDDLGVGYWMENDGDLAS